MTRTRMVSIMTTLRCPARCRHCVLSCGPDRTESLDWEAALAIIGPAAQRGMIDRVLFTGGEPLLFGRELRQFARAMAAEGVGIGIITCCYWAHTPETAYETLNRIPNLKHIVLSTDRFHQEFIPVERVRNALSAAYRVGIPDVSIATLAVEESAEVWRVRQQLSDILQPATLLAGQPIVPAGRARSLVEGSCSPMSGPSRHPCEVTEPLLLYDLTCVACCGPLCQARELPLTVGQADVESLGDLFHLFDTRPLLRGLRTIGPTRIAEAVVAAGGPDALARRRFVASSPCHVCMALFSDRTVVEQAERLLATDEWQRRMNVIEFVHRGHTEQLACAPV